MAENCNVLIVEADQKAVDIAAPLLKEGKCKVSYVKQGLNVVTHLLKNDFRLLILADTLPDEDGFRVLRRIREKEELAELPIILMLSSADNIENVFADGASDYILKPLDPREVKARLTPYINNIIIKNNCIEESRKKADMVKKLDDAFMEMEVMSRIDPLTSILNRRTLLEKILDEQIRSRRSQKRFSLLLLDIKKCSRFNERFGYECGDYIIKKTARFVEDIVRERDFTARWQGDQFMILLPETEEEGVEIIKNKINNSLEQTIFTYNGVDHKIEFLFSHLICTGKDDIDKIINNVESILMNEK